MTFKQKSNSEPTSRVGFLFIKQIHTMNNIPEITKDMISQEIAVTQAAMDDLTRKLGNWSGGFTMLENLTNQFDGHWPRLEFLRLLLTKDTLTAQELTLFHQGSLTAEELVAFKQQLV